MVNLIESFLENTEQLRIFTINDKRKSDYPEVYFFMGKDSALCISKQENKVLYHIKYSQLQISITSPNEFTLNVGGTTLFFSQNDEIATMEFLDKEEGFTKEKIKSSVTEDNKYSFKAICDKCDSKKCSQYDTINGRNFKFGRGKISEDMLMQYDKYCETKIKKFRCLE